MLIKAWGSFIVDLFSDTNTLSLSILILTSQCACVAKEINDKIVPGEIIFDPSTH